MNFMARQNQAIKEKLSSVRNPAELLKQRAIKRLIKNENIHFIKAKALSDLCVKPKQNEQ